MKHDYAITNKDINQPVNLKGDKDIRLKSDFRSKIETKFNMFYEKSENGMVDEFTVSPKLFIKWHKEVMFKRQKNGWFTGTTDINNHDDTILFTQIVAKVAECLGLVLVDEQISKTETFPPSKLIDKTLFDKWNKLSQELINYYKFVQDDLKKPPDKKYISNIYYPKDNVSRIFGRIPVFLSVPVIVPDVDEYILNKDVDSLVGEFSSKNNEIIINKENIIKILGDKIHLNQKPFKHYEIQPLKHAKIEVDKLLAAGNFEKIALDHD